MGKARYRPWEIDRLTFPEVEMALAEDLEKPLSGVQLKGDQEIAQYATWWRGLSWREKIDMARE